MSQLEVTTNEQSGHLPQKTGLYVDICVIFRMEEFHLKVDACDGTYRRESTGSKNRRYAKFASCSHLQLPNHDDWDGKHSKVRERIKHGR